VLELAPCPGDGSAGHRQLAVHDGHQVLGAVSPSGACTRPGHWPPSGTWVPRVGSAGRVKGFGEPPQNPRNSATRCLVPTGIPLISARSCRSSTPTWRARGS